MAATIALVVIDSLLLVLAFYFIQEGQAQRANPNLVFFVDFPTGLLPLAYLAVLLLLPNFAVIFFAIVRNLYRRRWPWLTTAMAVILLGVIGYQLGLDGIRTIIDPGFRG
jgi:hypothetical protein